MFFWYDAFVSACKNRVQIFQYTKKNGCNMFNKKKMSLNQLQKGNLGRESKLRCKNLSHLCLWEFWSENLLPTESLLLNLNFKFQMSVRKWPFPSNFAHLWEEIVFINSHTHFWSFLNKNYPPTTFDDSLSIRLPSMLLKQEGKIHSSISFALKSYYHHPYTHIHNNNHIPKRWSEWSKK